MVMLMTTTMVMITTWRCWKPPDEVDVYDDVDDCDYYHYHDNVDNNDNVDKHDEVNNSDQQEDVQGEDEDSVGGAVPRGAVPPPSLLLIGQGTSPSPYKP